MEWVKKEDKYRVPIKSWCKNVEELAMKQAEDLAMHPAVFRHVSLMPDRKKLFKTHLIFSWQVGGCILFKPKRLPANR